MRVKRFVLSVICCLGLLGATAAAAGAEAGPYHQPGYEVAKESTPCVDHGSFGYFGAYGEVHDLGINNLGSNGAPGADGTKTGYNNSHLCGSPQN